MQPFSAHILVWQTVWRPVGLCPPYSSKHCTYFNSLSIRILFLQTQIRIIHTITLTHRCHLFISSIQTDLSTFVFSSPPGVRGVRGVRVECSGCVQHWWGPITLPTKDLTLCCTQHYTVSAGCSNTNVWTAEQRNYLFVYFNKDTSECSADWQTLCTHLDTHMAKREKKSMILPSSYDAIKTLVINCSQLC